MALVGKPSLLCNQGKRLLRPAQQGFCKLEPALDDIALRSNPGRLLERAAEVVWAKTGDVGQHSKREIVLEMRLDLVTHPPQSLRREALAAGLQGQQ